MELNTFRFYRLTVALILVFSLLLIAGCRKEPDATAPVTQAPTQISTETEAPPTTLAPSTAETEPIREDPNASLLSLRQAMAGTLRFFAVAYFGYHETLDSDLPVDPFLVMQETAPGLCDDLPFLLEIPRERIIGETGDLFCIVPLDEDATVAVSKGCWDDENQQNIYDDILYSSNTGEPILLFCNNAGWEPDTLLFLSGPSGESYWYPRTDENLCAEPLVNVDWEELFLDFSPYREMLTERYESTKTNIEWEPVLPTEEMLIGRTWAWDDWSGSGVVTFREDILEVCLVDGTDILDAEYLYAGWELTQEDGYAVLTVNSPEREGVLRYNLLYSAIYDSLYVAMDVLQEDMPIGTEPLHRYLVTPSTPEPIDMVGTWELAQTEVDGYREQTDTCTVEITGTDEDDLRMWYTDRESALRSFGDKALFVMPSEDDTYLMGTDWMAQVNHTGELGTSYCVTLLDYDTLLVRQYWTVDGAPAVGWFWFRRV